MAFDWSQFLHLAKELAGYQVQQVDLEAKFRSSVSRAYYAAFCKARNYIKMNDGFLSKGVQDHQDVPLWFKNRTDMASKSIAENLKRLRANRNKSDYNDEVEELPRLVEQSLSFADKVLIALKKA